MAEREAVQVAIDLMRMAIGLLDRADGDAASVAAAHVQGAIDALGTTTGGDLDRALAQLDSCPTSTADV